jgi:hypothetical protein
MSTVFPSIEFFTALMEQVPDGSGALEAVGDDDILLSAEVGDSVFMIELADRACVAVAFGANPNDMDFVLRGEPASWLELLAAARGDAAAFSALLGPGARVDVSNEDVLDEERFAQLLPAIQRLFAGAEAFEWSPR